MIGRRRMLRLGAALTLVPVAVTAQAEHQAASTMNQLGPEGEALAQRVGRWAVIETIWDNPGAAPESTTGQVADRRMAGSILQEIIHPMADEQPTAVSRIDYLTYNRVEGRWDYVSMDTRAPVGIMPAWSFTRGEDSRILLSFEPFAIAGSGADVAGQMLRMEQVITHQGPDRDMKEQYFILADGTGTRWLAHRYSYSRLA